MKKWCSIVLLLSVISLLTGKVSLAEIVSEEKGVIDATNWDFKGSKLLPLKGEWELYWLELFEPADFVNNEPRPSTYITLPTDLSRLIVGNQRLHADGYATLRLKVMIDDSTKVYGLKSNYLSSAHKLWVNGELLATAGKVGQQEKEYSPAYIPLQTVFKTELKELEIIIQIANYHHRRVRVSPVFLGNADQINHATQKGLLKDSILFGSILLIGIYHVILYCLQRNNKAFLYFSLISFLVSMRVGIVNERLFVVMLPNLPAEWMAKLGYLPVFLLLPLFLLYMKELFVTKELEVTAKIARFIIPIIVFIVLVTSVKFYDLLFQYGQWVIYGIGVSFLYFFYMRIFRQKKGGSYAITFGILVVLLTALLDGLREFDIIQTPELFTSGILIFILSQGVYLAWRYNDSFNEVLKLAQENEAMYEEIQELNDQLEQKIKARTVELRKANNKLDRLSKLDPLTNLPNRRFFNERLEEVWQHSLQRQQPLALLLVDIDFFKGFNDLYGHLEGDQCLKKVAERLKSQLQEDTDFIARYGGEEFVVLLSNTDSDSALVVADKLRKAVEQLQIGHEQSSVSSVVTVSIGISVQIITDDLSLSSFFNQADQALYVAKYDRRNCVKLYNKY